jgi:hypothetical protein
MNIQLATFVVQVSRALRLRLRNRNYLGFIAVIVFAFAGGCGAPNPKASGPTKPITHMATAGCSSMALGIDADFNGLLPFSSENAWNQDVSSAPVDPDSDGIIRYINGTAPLHADFDDANGGIPYIVVDSSTTPLTDVHFSETAETDVLPMPIPTNAPIEVGTDHHVIVIDRKTCWLYEFWRASYLGQNWTANNGAAWDLQDANKRPYGWTSADAAGLPILPGLVRYEEVASGEVHHAFRFTLPRTTAALVPPATHWAQTDRGSPIPMGIRLRLKADFDISGFSQINQVILRAMKKYGLILADNGAEMYVTGAPDSRWSNYDLGKLRRVRAFDFEVLKMPPRTTKAILPTGKPPKILSFAAPPPALPTAHSAVTLRWRSIGASYFYITPSIGAVRGDSVVVNPADNTKYQLTATGPFGRTTATTKVKIR